MNANHMRPLHNEWLRSSAQFSNVLQQLEGELQRMRDRKISQELIDSKDCQVQALVDFYNQTDELLQSYRLALANARMENHFLTDILSRKLTIEEIMKFKPSTHVLIANMENGESRTLSSINHNQNGKD
jgi:hypothetical protein